MSPRVRLRPPGDVTSFQRQDGGDVDVRRHVQDRLLHRALGAGPVLALRLPADGHRRRHLGAGRLLPAGLAAAAQE